MKTKQKIQTLLNVVLYGVMIVVNALANSLPINGKTTGELSETYPNLFVPVGITFSIWGIIYLLLFLFVIYQFIASFGRKDKLVLSTAASGLFGFTCILNGLWIIVWHYELIVLSVAIMIVLLLTLIKLFLLIDTIEFAAVSEKIALKLPISVYLGWISVATIANITALLVALNWNGFGVSPVIWTIIMIGSGAIISLLMIILRKNFAFAIVIIWAYLGIISKRMNAAIVYEEIIYTCYVAIAVIIGTMIYTHFRKKDC